MKKVLLVLCIILLTACGQKEVLVQTDGAKFEQEYEALNDKGIVVDIDTNAKVKYLELNEVVDFLENKTGIIYFGFPGCPWCRNILPVLLNVAKDNNEMVYYFNPRDVRGTNNEDFNKVMAILDEYLDVNSDGEKTLYVPDVYFVKEGNIVGHYLGSVSSQTNPYEALTETQKQELYNIYKDLLDKIK